jgi:hypothetical protein
MRIVQWVLTIVLVSSSGLQAWAMENHSDVLRDQHGNALGGATVRVYNPGTTTLATIYSDNGTTAKSNPFLTDALTGRYNFYATNGVYDLTFTYQNASFDANHTKRVALFDVNDFSGGGGGGVSSCYRLVSASSYTVVSGDNGCLIEFQGTVEVTVTLPQAGTTGFGSSFRFTVLNTGVDNVNVVPTTSTIQGDTSLTVVPATSTDIASDGTNYVYTPGLAADSGWPLASTNKTISWATSEANAAVIGDGTRTVKIWGDATSGPTIKPAPLADAAWRCWTNFNCVIRDEEAGLSILTIDPDAATKNAMYQFGTNYKPVASILVPLSPRGAATMTELSVVTNQPKDWWGQHGDADTDAFDFRFVTTGKMVGVTTATVRLYGVSTNASPSGNIQLHCAMRSNRPGTDTYVAHSTAGEQAVTLTPAVQNRPVSAVSPSITINGTVAEFSEIEGSCEVSASGTTSTQLANFYLRGTALIQFAVNSLSD